MDSNPSACSSDQAVVTIDVHSTKTLLNSGHRYLDVRTSEEFEKGHLDKSLNVPYVFHTPQGIVKNQNFLEEVIHLCNKDDFIVVGCHNGMRSLKATEDLLKALEQRLVGMVKWKRIGVMYVIVKIGVVDTQINKNWVGFKNVKNMGDGYALWLYNGFEVKKKVDELR